MVSQLRIYEWFFAGFYQLIFLPWRIIWLRSKYRKPMQCKYLLSQKKTLFRSFKKHFVKKIRRFIVIEFMKACDELVSCQINWNLRIWPQTGSSVHGFFFVKISGIWHLNWQWHWWPQIFEAPKAKVTPRISSFPFKKRTNYQ